MDKMKKGIIILSSVQAFCDCFTGADDKGRRA